MNMQIQWPSTMTDTLTEQLETDESMFVQTASGASTAQTALSRCERTRRQRSTSSDRPRHVVGRLTTADFVDLRDVGDNSFQTGPPNCVLSFLEPGAGVAEDVVIVLRRPHPSSSTATSLTRSTFSREQCRRMPAAVTLYVVPFDGLVARLGVRGALPDRRGDRPPVHRQPDRRANRRHEVPAGGRRRGELLNEAAGLTPLDTATAGASLGGQTRVQLTAGQ